MNKNLRIEIINDQLVLVYKPYTGTDFIDFSFCDEISILKNCITLTREDIVDLDEDEISISIARLENDYYSVNKRVFSLKHSFYFHKDIDFVSEMFIYSYDGIRESVLKTLDEYVETDFYVENYLDRCDSINHVPIHNYKQLMDLFPKKTEIHKYIGNRINYIVEEFISGAEDRVKDYEHYIELKNEKLKKLRESSSNSTKDEFDALMELKTNVLITTKEWLLDAIEHSVELNEHDFQEKILLVILSLFPKYIIPVRLLFRDLSGWNKQVTGLCSPLLVMIDLSIL